MQNTFFFLLEMQAIIINSNGDEEENEQMENRVPISLTGEQVGLQFTHSAALGDERHEQKRRRNQSLKRTEAANRMETSLLSCMLLIYDYFHETQKKGKKKKMLPDILCSGWGLVRSSPWG